MRVLHSGRCQTLFAGAAITLVIASRAAPAAVETAPKRIILTPTADPSTSQTMTWRSVGVTTDVEATAEIRDTNGRLATVDAVVRTERYAGRNPIITFAATFKDLSANSEYSYRVITANSASDWHKFTTASSSDDPFTFTWYADGQRDLTEKWAPIVNLTSQAFPESELTLQTGDLVQNSVENEWDEWFTIIDGERQTENWLPAVGNHEYASDSQGTYWHANFTLPSNGPSEVGTGADIQYRELIANHLDNRVYYTDYQGARFITLSSEVRDQDDLETEQGVDLPDISSGEWSDMYLGMQADWLGEVLESSDANWHVVQFHHPVFSVSEGRDNPAVRDAMLPVIQEYDVDLVLSGHDHTYSRGFLNEDATETDGVTDGPVFAVSNSGPKYYDLANEESDVWFNGATQGIEYEDTSLTAGIHVTPEAIEYEAIAVRKGSNSNFDGEIGETADAFTITKNENDTKSVTEGIEHRVATRLDGANAAGSGMSWTIPITGHRQDCLSGHTLCDFSAPIQPR